MTTKKKIVVPVVQQKYVEVRRLGTRATKDFEDELRGLFEQGYKVIGQSDSGGVVKLQLAKTVDWTFEEFMADVRERLASGARSGLFDR